VERRKFCEAGIVERSYARLRRQRPLALVVPVLTFFCCGICGMAGVQLTTCGGSPRGGSVCGWDFLWRGCSFAEPEGLAAMEARATTQSSYVGFLLAKIGMALVLALLTAITVTLVLPRGTRYQLRKPQRCSCRKPLHVVGDCGRRIFFGALVGFIAGGQHTLVTLSDFTLWRPKILGAGAPQEINYKIGEHADSVIGRSGDRLAACYEQDFTFRLFCPFLFLRG